MRKFKCIKEQDSEYTAYVESNGVLMGIEVDGEIYTREITHILKGYSWKTTARGIEIIFTNSQGREFKVLKSDLFKFCKTLEYI